ncbi:hypothetical protein [Streptomyces sp. NBC_01216]|uniref:hypothetical protein n=1 Tax=unclassified Streptomyces TaxID=2593676 RepID=UPI002E0F7330|nr:hypothetical protein OG393_16095 [Streptomyces sp. NBC_01216]
MTLNATWEELFGGTGPSGRPASMTLAGLPAEDRGGGGGDANLKADEGPWHGAGRTSGELRVSTGTALTDLGTANEGVTGGTAGFDSSAALTEILGTWKTRLTAVRDECGRLETALRSAGRDFGEREADTQRRIAAETPVPARKKEG